MDILQILGHVYVVFFKMPQKLVAPKKLKLEKIARLTLQEIRYLYLAISQS